MSQQTALMIGGLSTGCLYALIAAGFAVLLKSSHRFNFAHISLVLLAGYLVYQANVVWELPFAVGILVAAALTAVASVVVYFAVARPLTGRQGGLLAVAIATIGVDAALRGGIAAYTPWNLELTEVGTPWQAKTVTIFGASVYESQLWLIGITVAAVVLLMVGLERTRYGLLFRAIAEDEETASANGINLTAILVGAWVLAGVLAAIAGTFAGTFPRLLSPASTPELALRAIPGVVIGGMGSIGGAIVGGALVGVVEVYTARYAPEGLGSNFHLVMPYLVMVLVLVFRPQGFFGHKEIRRV